MKDITKRFLVIKYDQPYFPLEIQRLTELSANPPAYLQLWFETANIGEYAQFPKIGTLVRLQDLQPCDDFHDYERDWGGFQYGE